MDGRTHHSRRTYCCNPICRALEIFTLTNAFILSQIAKYGPHRPYFLGFGTIYLKFPPSMHPSRVDIRVDMKKADRLGPPN